jgi:hypothetical protein
MTNNSAANTAAHALAPSLGSLTGSNHEELMAVLTTVDDLVNRSVRLTRTAQELQSKLPS